MEVVGALGLLAYVLCDAYSQGLLNRLTRKYVPPSEQPTVNRSLHVLYPICYGLFVGAVASKYGLHMLGIGLLMRVAVFDLVLNHTVDAPAFSVGQSAKLDRFLRKLSPKSEGRVASLILRIAAWVGAMLLLLLFDPVA